jgi:hypothetical protein
MIKSASALPLLAICAGSAVLDRVHSVNDKSKAGQAIHDHMRLRASHGVDYAVAMLERTAAAYDLDEKETGFFIARCKGFTWSPPAGAFGEVALCLCDDGTVVRVTGGAGSYAGLPANAVVPGQVDLMWSEPEPLDMSDPAHPRCPKGSILWVVDYKSGKEDYVEPIERNIQVGTYTMMAAKWTGAEYAVPAILFVRKGSGEWDAPEAAWGTAEISAAEKRAKDIVARGREQLERLARGEVPVFTEGKHCEFCDAAWRCPAKTAVLKALVGAPLPKGSAPLTVEERSWLAAHLKQFEAFARAARTALILDVQANGAIPLEDGTVWGPIAKPVTEIIVPRALPVLQEELGEELANNALDVTLSRGRIEANVKKLHHEQGLTRQVAPTMRRIMAKISEAGGLLSEPRIEHRAYRPHDEEDEGEAA